jgi:indole-3-glycerol phosphate synthase
LILLIAAVCREEIKSTFLKFRVLLEVHNQEELKIIIPTLDMIGVNNRNLKTFEVRVLISASN